MHSVRRRDSNVSLENYYTRLFFRLCRCFRLNLVLFFCSVDVCFPIFEFLCLFFLFRPPPNLPSSVSAYQIQTAEHFPDRDHKNRREIREEMQ